MALSRRTVRSGVIIDGTRTIVRALPRLPVDLQEGPGIGIERTGLAYTVSLDTDSLIETTDPDLADSYVAVSSSTGYARVNLDVLSAAAAGGNFALDDLTDVTTGTPADGNVLAWDAGTSQWVSATGSGSLTLDDLADVNATTPTDGDIIVWDATAEAWVTAAGSTFALDDLTNVDAAAPDNGDVLSWDSAASAWVPSASTGGGTFALNDLTDVSADAPSDGHVLTWDATASSWITAAGGGSGAADAADVTFTPTGSIGSTNVQEALAEVASDIAGLSAADVGFAPVGDILSTDAQAAIEEVLDLATQTAAEVGYDNTTSGLTATEVQAALDEVAGLIPDSLAGTAVTFDPTGTTISATDMQTALAELASEVSPAGTAATITDSTSIDWTHNTSTEELSAAVKTTWLYDQIKASLVAGANVTLTANDVAETITVASSGGGGGGATTADVVTFTPAGDIVATDVQAALEELDDEKAPKTDADFVGYTWVDENPTSGTSVTGQATRGSGTADRTVAMFLTKSASAADDLDTVGTKGWLHSYYGDAHATTGIRNDWVLDKADNGVYTEVLRADHATRVVTFQVTPLVGSTAVSLVGHTHVAANITNFAESVDDQVAALLAAGTHTNISLRAAAERSRLRKRVLLSWHLPPRSTSRARW
jgi:hypothetical protein